MLTSSFGVDSWDAVLDEWDTGSFSKLMPKALLPCTRCVTIMIVTALLPCRMPDL